MDLQNSKLLNWDACLNARELGGYPARDGKKLRWKALVRADNSTYLTPTGVEALLDYGIRTVVDLRFVDELENWPSPLAKLPEEQLTYVNVPLDTDQDVDRRLLADPAQAETDLYVRLLETNRGYMSAALTAIARARDGGVLFHCHAGKDRTGLIAACLLGVLGVPKEVIVNDYIFSTPQLEARRESVWADPAKSAEERTYLQVLVCALPETMQKTLRYLDENYGGVEGYLRTTPLLDETVRTLRARLLE